MITIVQSISCAFPALARAARAATAVVLCVLWTSAAFSATLVWNSNVDPYTAGYRVYARSGLEFLQFDVGPSTNLLLDFAKPGRTYLFEVVAYNEEGVESAPSDALEYLVPIPFGWPTILVHPAPVIVAEGGSAFFFAQTTASGNLRYQWLKNGSEITGATNLFLSLVSVPRAAVGRYSVRIANDLGSIESEEALLSVLTPPEIVSHTKSFSADVGAPILLAVTASGTDPLVYAWFKDGEKLKEGSDRLMYIDRCTLSDAGIYTVEVSNEIGTVSAGPIEVAVKDLKPAELLVQREGPVFILGVQGEPYTVYLIEMISGLGGGTWEFATELETDSVGTATFELESAYGEMRLFRALELLE